MCAYEETDLWKRSLGERTPETEVNRLRAAYDQFRSRVEALVQRISPDLPGLTVHDITHLDALWGVADVVAGPDYPINPLEGFVLGGAILIHDAGLTFAAYEGGREGVRRTRQWRDAYGLLCARESGDAVVDADAESNRLDADFLAMRSIHAGRAKTLAVDPVLDHAGHNLYLIEDSSLRVNLGALIGLIAASHHWSIEDVVDRIPRQFNAPSDFPERWQVDGVKLACLLRCADAAHLDAKRAPDFLMSLLRPAGLSSEHWLAQNRLARVSIDQADPAGASLLFTSTRPFEPTQKRAWWVAYEAMSVADAELRSSAATLPEVPFRARTVAALPSPVAVSQFVTTEGWTPTDARPRVQDVVGLIRSLGGKQLYGANADPLMVTLRELIQNARDAIAARRKLRPEWNEGRITVRARRNGGVSLDVCDNGVGMSERVLTGPLLDFGGSLWQSDLSLAEFPGLWSDGSFRPAGRYGIGFYSAFTVCKELIVKTRRWTEGAEKLRKLHFESLGHPTLVRPQPTEMEEFESSLSTMVTCKLLPDYSHCCEGVSIGPKRADGTQKSVPFDDYVAAIVVGLDTPVFVQIDDGAETCVHPGHPIGDETRGTSWLERISHIKVDCVQLQQLRTRDAPRLREILDGGQLLGFAAVSLDRRFTPHRGYRTVGGLAGDLNANTAPFVGFIDCIPNSAARAAGAYAASTAALKNWADGQRELLTQAELGDEERYCGAMNLFQFGCDVSQFCPIPVWKPDGTRAVMSLDDVASLVERGERIGMYQSAYVDRCETHLPDHSASDILMIYHLDNSEFASLSRSEEGFPTEGLAFYLHRSLVGRGCTPVWKLEQTEKTGPLFGKLRRLVLSTSS